MKFLKGRRFLAPFVSALLAGAVVNIVVAWLCNANSFARNVTWIKKSKFFEEANLYVEREDGTDFYEPGELAWPDKVPEDWPAPESVIEATARGYSTVSANIGSAEPFTPLQAITADYSRRYLVVTRVGWPWPALQSVRLGPSSLHDRLQKLSRPAYSSSARFVYDSSVGIAFRISPNRHIELPLRPIALGFVANTLLYASMSFAVAAGLRTIRRASRSRKGLCVKCAYPVAGLAWCPECGRVVTKPRSRGDESPVP